MGSKLVPADTSPEVFAMMVERWRSMPVSDKAELMEAMSIEVDQIARSGIRMREPNISRARENWLMMSRRYGRALAMEVLGTEPIA
jgi:hypothetical protein